MSKAIHVPSRASRAAITASEPAPAVVIPVDYQGLVAEFHRIFNHPIADAPTLVDEDVFELRYKLILEELDEYKKWAAAGDLMEIADALGDILYVTFGTALVHGINLGPVFEEIQRSNMTKLGEDGQPIFGQGEEVDGYPEGKILKGPNYETPQLEPIILQQQADGAWS